MFTSLDFTFILGEIFHCQNVSALHLNMIFLKIKLFV